jgi:hypothetical protein
MSTPSQGLFGHPVNPVYLVRAFLVATILPLALAMFVFRTGESHDFCLGLGMGLLISHLAMSFSFSNVEIKDNSRPSDVEDIRVTP